MKKIGIYPGNFQPADRSHYEVYKKLKSLVGDSDVFVATTDREPIPEAPLNFGDKEQIWIRHGVPASHIIKVQSLPTDDIGNSEEWRPKEIFNRFSAKHTAAIIVLNEKEAEFFGRRKDTMNNHDGISADTRAELNEIYKELAIPDIAKDIDSPESEDPHDVDFKADKEHDIQQHKEIWLNSKNEPSYFQPYRTNEHNLRPFNEHAYIVIMDDSKIQGHIISTTNIRNVLGSNKYNDDQKKKFFRWVFGWFDIGLYQLMVFKFRNAHHVVYPDDEPSNQSSNTLMTKTSEPRQPIITPKPEPGSRIYNKNRKLQEIVYEVLKELVDEDYSSSSSNDTNSMAASLDAAQKTPAQQAKEKSDRRINLVKQKKELEAKDKQEKQQRDNYSTVVKNYDQFQKLNNRNAIDNVNKQLSQPTVPTQPIS
jgi:hypothetical protein